MSERFVMVVFVALLMGCGHVRSRRVIVIGVDGMDPEFVEAHWTDLPNLNMLRQDGAFLALGNDNPAAEPCGVVDIRDRPRSG